MSVPAAYLSIILIWSTTPLAIQWSASGNGFLFPVMARMAIGLAICVLLLGIFRIRMPWHREARMTYLAAGLGILGTMLCVYWGARYISSGLIALLFGLTPIFTSIAAALWLEERNFTASKIVGTVLGLAGLAAIFGSGLSLGEHAVAGMLVVLFAVMLQSLSLVWVKRIGATIPAMAVTSGALMLVAPALFVIWEIFDGVLPQTIAPRASWAIAYLGIFGSVLGFNFYFYVIKRMEAGQIALITLITPVSALLLGQMLNGEKIQAGVWAGAACVLLGLLTHQWQVLSGGLLRKPLV
ncbi:MAG: EamA family transporter [Gallionellales bacterium 35-53-114]|jgi:drug/metabolite transporter (DMT)-like permease|nr:MAG: EamA family transporter [Gallionellales bacterium 35-53-114]OYZ65466.1 MAG: EamA family transporter [Gallionellales bacterium 24-53-125]OZB08372.1 MAG: EamA family transporter [Gallionellales bacterium 39-52-133]HQS58315.1 DMT family transporter [Gallionellaceae bacterium]HQS73870.1 DMT family transporter [Gallionellaceae bacterium]